MSLDNSKILSASCQGGKVTTAEGANVPDVKVLSAGAAKSEGVVLLSGPDTVYIAVPVGSLGELIDLVAQAVDAVSQGVLPSNAGGNITSPDFALQLAQVKQNLQKLKDNLQ